MNDHHTPLASGDFPVQRDLDQLVPGPLRHELVRPGLLARLEAAHDVKLVVLAAPSGFGKTTLLAQYARAELAGRPVRPVVWLALANDDAEPGVLARRLADAASAAVPALALEHVRQAPSSARALAADLNGAEASFSLVLDRAERLGTDAGLWLETLLGSLAEGHRLLLGGYEARLRVARLVAEEVAVILGPAELAFSQQEAEAYLHARGYTHDPAAAWRMLEGWPAGLSLVAAGASPRSAPADLVLEMLDHLPEDLRRGLGEASVLESWSDAHAGALGLELPAGWLAAARGAGLGLTPLSAGAYRPHRLLREVLENELRARPERHGELRRRAAGNAERAGEPLEALEHYRKGGLGEEAGRLALELVPRFEGRGEYHLMRQVLEGLDLARLPPTLARSLGTALCHSGEAGRGEAILRGLRAAGRADVPALLTLGELARRHGQFGEALARFEKALPLAKAGGERADLACARVSALSDLGRFEEARSLARGAADWAEQADDLPRLAHCLHLLAACEQGLGHHGEATALLERALSLYGALGQPLGAVGVRIDLADAYLAQGRCGRALDQLERAQAVAEPAMSSRLPLLAASRAEIHFWRGEYPQAAAAYREAIRRSEEFGLELNSAAFWTQLIEAARRAGDLEGAGVALQRAQTLTTAVAAPRWRVLLAFQQGMIAFLTGRLEEAAAHFGEAQGSQSVHGARATLYLAELARLDGRLERAHVAEIVGRLDSFGSDNLLRLDAGALAGLYAELAGRGWWPERFCPFVSPSPVPPEAGVALEVFTLGRIGVRVGGQPVHLPFARCGELLAWLALYGPAPRDRIVDALWDGERGHLEYFRVVVRKLRMALSEPSYGFNPLPYEGGLYRLTGRYEQYLDVAELEPALGSREPARLRSALDSYRGEFLPGVESEWVSLTRARVRDTALSLALALGASLEPDDPPGALAAYRRAVELDPLAEGGHFGLVRVFTRLDDRASADHARRAYARTLQEGLGTAGFPDPGGS